MSNKGRNYSLVIRERQMKIIMRYPSTLTRFSKISVRRYQVLGEKEQWELLPAVGWGINGRMCSEKAFFPPLSIKFEDRHMLWCGVISTRHGHQKQSWVVPDILAHRIQQVHLISWKERGQETTASWHNSTTYIFFEHLGAASQHLQWEGNTWVVVLPTLT